jgi:hypothetical protein
LDFGLWISDFRFQIGALRNSAWQLIQNPKSKIHDSTAAELIQNPKSKIENSRGFGFWALDFRFQIGPLRTLGAAADLKCMIQRRGS